MLIKRRTYLRRLAYAPKLFSIILAIGRGVVPLHDRLRVAIHATVSFLSVRHENI